MGCHQAGRSVAASFVLSSMAPRRRSRRPVAIVVAAALITLLALLLLASGPADSAAAAKAGADRYAAPEGQTDDVVIYDRGLYYEVHVSLTGSASPYQIGQQYAQAMLEADPWWTTKIYTYLLAAPSVVHVSYRDMVARSSAIKQSLSPEVRGYIEGMASVVTRKSAGFVNENDCYVLNLYPDVARPTMCSALGAWGHYTAGGRPVVGRNLDWSDDFILPTLNAVTVYHNGAKSFCSLGYLGLWQVISGFNPSGLYAGILDAETGKPYPDPTNRHSYAMDLRTVLETTKTVSDAAAVMQKSDYCFDHQILLADKTRVGVLENDLLSKGPWSRKVRLDNTPLNPGITWEYKDAVCAINSFIAKGNDGAKFSTPWNTERWKAFKAQMKMVGTMTVDKMKDIMSYGDPDSTTKPYNSLTTMMMVYQPVTRHLELFMKPRKGGLPKHPTWKSIDIDFGKTMFAGRWVREWQPEGWEVTDADVAPSDVGDVFAALQLSRDAGADKAIGLVRYAANGKRLWTRIIDPAGAESAELAGLSLSSGAVVVGGTRVDGTDGAWLLARYTTKGKRSWLKTGDGTAGHMDRLGGLVCDARGNIYAGGSEVVAEGAQDWCLRKFSAAGTQRWERLLGSGAGLDDCITDVTRLGATTVVSGTWGSNGATAQLAASRFADGGARRWFTSWTHASVVAPEASGLSARQSGIAVSGHDAGATGRNGRVAFRLDPSSGALEWEHIGVPELADQSTAYNDIAIDQSGDVVAAGHTTGVVGAGQHGLLSWFDDAGVHNAVDFGGSAGVNQASSVTCSNNGMAFVTGAVTEASGAAQQMATTCWTPGSTLRWSITYGGTSSSDEPCIGHDLQLRGSKLFVAGSAGTGFVLAKYDITTAALAETTK